MKKKLLSTGLLAMVLTFGIIFMGCNDGGGNDLSPPGSPNIRAEATATTITLSWEAATRDILDYRFSRANDTEGPFTNQGTVSAPSIITELSITGLLPDTTYYFRIIATNGAGSSRATELTVSTKTEAEVDDNLNVPANFRVTTTLPSSITLAYESVSGTGYELAFATNAEGPWTNYGVSTATTRSISSLNKNTTYYFRIRTVGYNAVSEWSTVINATTSTFNAPTNISADSITATSMRITWDSVVNAQYFQIQRAISIDGPWINVTAYTSSFFVNATGLDANTAYYFRVRASTTSSINDDNSSEWATSGPFTTKNEDGVDINLNAPANLIATAITPSSITLAFESVSGATGYELAFATSASGPWTNHSGGTGTSRTHNPLNVNTTYYYRVRTISYSSVSEWSTVINATTSTYDAPANITVNSITPSGMRITWDSVVNTQYFQIQHAISTDGPWLNVINYTSNLFIDVTGLKPDTAYYFRVRASNNWSVDDDNSSEWSTVVGPFTTLTPPTVSLTAGTWVDGEATNANRLFWYTFDVVQGQQYFIWGNTQWSGDGTKTHNSSPFATIMNSDGTVNTTMYPQWSGQPFTANQTETIRMEVSFNSNGTFAIAFDTVNTRP
jgi:hypothetical protein